ncbi:MAG: CrcB family protein [Kineosporiaceae bacterium]|nr:CrcB family protein [Kineosporiaceae bacterium]MBK8076280.1 CrcB family protein [Kineosporiaceae bacterium]
MTSAMLVVAGGAVGAPTRYLVDRSVTAVVDRLASAREIVRPVGLFPWGTLVVNLVGSFLLGVISVQEPPQLAALLGAGFCGALTTYSTFGAQTLYLIEEGEGRVAAWNVGVSVVVGVAAAALGVTVAG